MKITVQTAWRTRDDGQIPVVEVWIGGRCFVHECKTIEEARKFALATIFDLGIGNGE